MTDEERKARIHHHMYTTNEGIAEHAERIVALEELCADIQLCLWQQEHHWHPSPCEECPREGESCDFERRMDELGVPR